MGPRQNKVSTLITINVILGNEILNVICRKKKGKGIINALKIVMEKAYDRISWN